MTERFGKGGERLVRKGKGYAMMQNLSKYHREHEKFYAQAPLKDATKMHAMSKTLKTLADRWIDLSPSSPDGGGRYAGCEDLNELAAIQHDGLLFMEGEGEPAEITRLKRDIGQMADDHRKTGIWLSTAMDSSWGVASSLTNNPELAPVLGDRNRIIANDWLAAEMSTLVSRLLKRSLEILDAIDFSPRKLRKDLSGPRHTPGYLYSSAELIDRAADLASESAALVHDNEYRRRRFRAALNQLSRTVAPSPSKNRRPSVTRR
jgi:hypothetical protein